MADTVSPQITDSVTQTNAKVLAESPAMAMGSIYQTMSHSLGILMENAVTNQQGMNMIAQAVASRGVMLIYSGGAATDAAAANEVLQDKK